MKKILIFIVCLAVFAAAAAAILYNNNEGSGLNAPIGGISTAEADGENTPEELEDTAEDDFSDRTEESDRKEIESNLRDARELIEDGYIEDATMIIDSLKTRDLTDAERKELLELQKMMIKVSD